MFPFIMTDKMIQDELTHASTYQKGLAYYFGKRVLRFRFNEEDLLLEAEVIGEKYYKVYIHFYEHGGIGGYGCDCPAFSNYEGICKHIVAVLKKAQQEYRYNNDHSRRLMNRSNVQEQLFDLFERTIQNDKKKEVPLEVTYEVERDYRGLLSSVSLRIGIDRLYIVRNINQFIYNIINNNIIEFGKKFTFDPKVHTFSEQDQRVIDLLKEVYEHEKMLFDDFISSHVKGGTFQGKKIYLSSEILKRLFKTVANKNIKAKILKDYSDNMEILEKEIPLVFELRQLNRELSLDLKEKQEFIPLTTDGEYIYFQGNIYHTSEQQRQYLIHFLDAFRRNTWRDITFSNKQKERFVSELLPVIRKAGDITIDEAVEQNFYQEELENKIYLDKVEDGISARIEFHYGTIALNPFTANQGILTNNMILVRDMEKEKKIMRFFEELEFKVGKGMVHLDDEDRIFKFIYEILPQLQEQAEIYYSDEFKEIKVKDPHAFSGGVRLNEKSNLLEFSFEYEDVPADELEHIFLSVQQKKKYYRLKDGSFMPLHIPELEQITELIDNLDISSKDLSKKVIELPKYRAIYLDGKLREADLQHIERNLAFKRLVQNISEPEDMEFDVPVELEHVLRDYQKVGYKWLKTLAAYGLGGILADDMGLGKTLQVIAFVLSEKKKKLGSSLVIVPTSLVYNWQDEIKKFTPHMHAVVVSGVQKERQQQIQDIKDADFVITSYPLIRRDIEMYKELEFAYCFLDEAQHIKNPHTINARSVKQIKAKGYFALTGTPIENALTELWSIFDFVMPKYLFSHTKFVKKYERPIIKKNEQKVLKELSKQIRPFILRRMKKDVLKELPQKIESKMTADMTEEQKKIYLAYLHQAKGEIAKEIAVNGFGKSHIKILAMLTRLRQVCCHPGLFIENYEGDSGKLALLQEILEDALEGGHRILIFSQFTSMLHIIKEHLNKQGIEYFYLDGATKSKTRGEMVNAFNKGEKELFLISLKAGGTGLNLTGADMVIHYDPWWNPAVEEQATDRAYRIGQKNVVQVIKLITQGTIEEKIFELQQKKKKMIETIIQPGETMLSKMSQDEIEDIFGI